MKSLTVEEFRKLKDASGLCLELRNGDVLRKRRPKLSQWILQTGLSDRFKAAFGNRGRAGTEFPFRPHPEHQLRVADVAWVSRERLKRTLKGDLLGAPEIVVEVLSPSNRASEMLDKKHLCFEAG
ncbi:MAG TPA: Uma2 family endonuclease [Bryobacteraceae bacterium]|jgi:Uma2 family endonuclease